MEIKMKHLATIFIALFCLTGCSSDKFKIEGHITDIGTQNLRVIYSTGTTINSMWIPIVDGKFSFEGSSPELTVVNIFNQQKGLIAHVVAKNGSNIKIEGSFKDPYKFKITGDNINEEWGEFINSHSDAIKKGNSTMIDIDIEKYIRSNKNSIVSTLLLMNDYSNLTNTETVDKLIAMIEPEARPEQLMQPYRGMSEESQSVNSKKILTSFILYSSADSIEGFNPSISKASLIYFWIPENNDRKEVLNKMKEISKKYGKSKLQLADITLENDSSIWKKEIKTDSVSWKQFWGLGGRMNNAVRSMQVNTAPYFIVTDSIGVQLYRGNSVTDACNAVTKKLK